jgi:biopolymer transport protein ExbB
LRASVLLVFVIGFNLWAQTPLALSGAVEKTRQDVVESTAELNALRAQIQSERLPLSTRVEDLNRRALTLRKQVETLRRAQTLRQQERVDLAAELDRLEQEKVFIDSVFEEYRRSLETRVLPAEWQYLQAQLPQSNEALWDWSLDWLEKKKNGYRFAGQVLDAEGNAETGEMLVLGPVAYFLNDTQNGLVITRPGSAMPGLYTLDAPLGDFAQGKSVSLPVDVSGGDAMKVAEAKPGLIAHLQQGGVVVVPLLLIGALALIMALRKTLDLQRMTVTLSDQTRQVLGSLNDQNAETLMQTLTTEPQPLASLLVAALQHRKASRTHLEEILHEHVLAVLPRLERSLGTLAVFGGVAPLLGLLGTVTGMIHTFQLVTIFGSGNAKTLSGGISEALVTTEVGLVIAIPILLVHAFLARKAKTLLAEMEQTAVVLVNILKSDDQTG